MNLLKYLELLFFKKLKMKDMELNIYGNIYLIFFIGINIISVKLGNIIPYFIYESIHYNNNNKIKNILITNPYSHFEKTYYGKINKNLDNYIDNINVKLLKLNEIQNKYSNIFNIIRILKS